jgi:hypothetical protein
MPLVSACALFLASCTDATAPQGVETGPVPNGAIAALALADPGVSLVSAMGPTFCADLNPDAPAGVQAVLNSCVADAPTQRWTIPAVGVAGAIRSGDRCLESVGSNGSNGDVLRLANCNNAANQRFTLTAGGELKGFTNRCISVDGASTAANTRLILWQCVGAANQKWTVRAGGATTPPVTAPPTPPTATPPVTPPPAVPATPGSGAGLVSAMGAAFCADVNATVAAVLNGCLADAPGQAWTVPAVGATGEIRVGERCLESVGASGGNGEPLRLTTCNTTEHNQRFTLTAAGELKGYAGRCISVDGASTAAGTRLILWQCVGAPNQKWTVRAGSTSTPTTPPTIPATPTPTPPTTPSTAGRVGHYVAPGGSPAGTGGADRPWDLATALSHPAAVRAGDTIWVRGGTYRGQFVSRLHGAHSAPVVVRQYPGERATVDGNMIIDGSSTVFWGLEVMSSNGSRPAIIGVNVRGPRTRFVNMVVHDAGDNGFGFWSEAPDAEIYGSIIYNNGRQSSTRGSAHGIYAQNRTGRKRIVDNILFNQFAYGIHVYGSDAASLTGFHVEGNASFNNGLSASGGGAPDLLVGGGSGARDITVASNYTYRADEGTTAVFGYNWGPANLDLALTDNYLVGGTNLMKWRTLTVTGNTFYGVQTPMMLTLAEGIGTSGYQFRNNEYRPTAGQWSPFNLLYPAGGASGYDLPGWQSATGLDASSTLTRGRPTGVKLFVRPNQYERGRANVIVYNWDRVGSVSVDGSGFMASGTRYEVRASQDFYGTPVSSGIYYGGSINIPIRSVQPPTPIGGSVTPPSTGVDFNVYVIVPVAQ